MEFKTEAFGKLNLTLDVLGLRPDGYHELEMLMQTVSLSDTVCMETETAAPWELFCTGSNLPQGPENLAWKAARAFYDATGLAENGLRIRIEKRIPSQAGMAGGSADAAAVLRLLNEAHGSPLALPDLCRVGERVGSDVPYCVLGGTALSRGRGERLTKLAPMPRCWFVLCKPDFSISTPELFHAIDGCHIARHPRTAAAMAAVQAGDLSALSAELCNVFEPLVLEKYPHAGQLREAMLSQGAQNVCMTGTGSVFYGVFDRKDQAASAQKALLKDWPRTFLAEPV